MSISPRPEIQAFAPAQGVDFQMRQDAIERFDGTLAVVAAEDRTINIMGALHPYPWEDEVSAKQVKAALDELGEGDINVNINSPGGSFFEGVTIYNLLRMHKGKVTVRVLGLAASAASVVSMAADELLMPKTSFLMIHNCWIMAIGNRHDLAGVCDELQTFDQSMADLYADRSGEDVTVCAQWMDDETWFTAEDAIANGLADGLFSSEAIAKGDEPTAKAIRAELKVEAALRFANPQSSRKERRALLSEVKTGTPRAVETKTDLRELAEAVQSFKQMVRSK